METDTDCTPPGSWEPLFLWMNGGSTLSRGDYTRTLAEAVSQMGH